MLNKKIGLAKLDQFVSSSSSIFAISLSSKFLGGESWGKFSSIIACYSIMVAISQSLLGEHFIIRKSIDKNFLEASGLFINIFLINSIVTILGGLGLLILKFAFPSVLLFCCITIFLLCQDTYRFVKIINGEVIKLLISDLTWLLLTMILFIVLKPNSLLTSLLCWGIPGMLAFVLIYDFRSNQSRPINMQHYLYPLKNEYKWLFLETLIGGLSNFLVLLFVSRILDFKSIGVLRLAMSFYGAVNVLINSQRTVDVLEESRRSQYRNALIKRFSSRILIVCIVAFVTSVFIKFLPIPYLESIASVSIIVNIRDLSIFLILDRVAVAVLMSVTVIERGAGRIKKSSKFRIFALILSAVLSSIFILLLQNIAGYFVGEILAYSLVSLVLIKKVILNNSEN